MATPVWESVKENAAPLTRGRRVEDLENPKVEENLRIVAHFEKLLTENRASDDPLIDWLRYIKFHQNHFPSHTHEQFLLLERCFRYLHNTQYDDDPRFIRICCMYADKTINPCNTFFDLYKLGIGRTSATFYNAWAYVAEREENFRLAEQIFEKGIRKHAQALPYLLQRQKHFQRRMSRYFLNLTAAVAQQEEELEGLAASTLSKTRRDALGSLSEMAVRRNDRSNTMSSRQQQQQQQQLPTWNARTSSTFRDRTAARSRSSTSNQESNQNSSNKNSFPIFVESNGDENEIRAGVGGILDSSFDIKIDRHPETQAEIYKENRGTAERWNERNGGFSHNHSYYSQRTTCIQPTSFAIHVDEECAMQHDREVAERRMHEKNQRMARDERFVLQSSEASVAEKLMHDPLRYIRDPQKLDTDQHHHQQQRGVENLSDTQEQKKSRAPAAWKNKLLRGSDKREQNFEQARLTAQYYTLGNASTNCNAWIEHNHDDDDESSHMSIDTSMQELLSESETYETHTSPFLQRKAFASRKDLKTGKPPTPKPAERLVPTTSASITNLSRIDNHTINRYRQDHSVSYENNPTPRNASAASSTVDEAVAVGVVGGKEEQTINTRLAVQELSMMFSSPALGLNESGILNRSGGLGPILDNNLPLNQSFNTIAEVDDDPDSSFAAESQHPTMAATAPSKSGGYMDKATEKGDMGDPSLAYPDVAHGPGFTVFEDEEEEKVSDPHWTKRKPLVQTPFPIFEEQIDVEKCDRVDQENSRIASRLPFRIFDESSTADSGDCNNLETATFTEVNHLFNSLGALRQNIIVSNDHRQLQSESEPECSSDGDTATLSIFNEICAPSIISDRDKNNP